MENREVYVIGGGALGMYLTSKLSFHDPITLVTRKPFDGGRIELAGDEQGEVCNFNSIEWEDLSIPTKATLFLCTKAYDLDSVLDRLMPNLSRETTLVLCQNGLGIHIQAAQQVGRRAPLIRMLSLVGVKKASCKIIVSGRPQATIAATPEDAEPCSMVGSLLNQAGFLVSTAPSIVIAEWEKAIINIVVNSIATLKDAPNGIILEDPNSKELAERTIYELRLVAAAEGVFITNLDDSQIFKRIENSKNNINSTLSDLRAGKPTEIEYMIGRAVRFGRSHQVKIPTLEQLYQGLKERGAV